MKLEVTRVEVWIASLKDTPGSLAAKLDMLSSAGADMDFVFARRSPEKPGTGVAFLSPVKGAKQAAAAKKAGFKKGKRLFTICVTGPNKAGVGAAITDAIAAAELTMQGFSAHVIGRKFVLHIAFETSADASKAARILRKL
ncbi:MAG: amino acid-binding protein [Phycisphaerae bacterium]|jgi:predicted amino acid-binding ACT domain protein|nr:amino acid-binding protein [Phycisphaerae bacterium]